MRLFLESLLALLARRIVARYRPTVVAVTGSVGKTSTRNAIAAALTAKFRVRSPEENYNNELGVPLTIIGMRSPGRSTIGWLSVLWKAVRLGYSPTPRLPDFPEVLVLEYGMERPGDIARLCDIARPDVGVLTAVSPVHAAYFSSIEALAEEKGEIVRRSAFAVLNGDDERVAGQRGEAEAVAYGFGERCDVRGEGYRVETRAGDPDAAFDVGEEFCAVKFSVAVGGERREVTLANVLGRGQAYAALAAVAVAARLGVSLDDAIGGLAALRPQAGRMRPLAGIKGCLVLDDTYNAAPASMASALETLSQFVPPEGARRVAVFGKMAELGRYSADEHRLLGIRAAEVADVLVCVGEEARDIRRGAIEAGMDERAIECVPDATAAGRWLDFNVRAGDVVLVKGSQSARMERAVKDIMAEPLRAADLLVRQYGKWLEE